MNVHTPRVSVVIPTFNRAELLVGAIESVRGQTIQEFEIVVVDDGSTDDTRERLHRLYAADPRVRYLHQDNAGPSAARNRGLAEARAEFIALLDSDDAWLPQKLERQLPVFDRDPSAGVVYCKFAFMDAAGVRLGKDWPRPASRGDLYVDLMYANVIMGSDSAVVMRTRDLREVGGFDERLFAVEDQDLWRRLALRHSFVLLDEVLVLVREHASSIQRDTMRMAKASLLHLAKIERETPQRFRHHLPDLARSVATDYTHKFMHHGRQIDALRFALRFAFRNPGRGAGIGAHLHGWRVLFSGWLAILRILGLELAFSAYGRLPEPVKNVWRWLKRAVRGEATI